MKDCGCLEKIKKRLVDHHGGAAVELDLRQCVDVTDTNATEFKFASALPPMYYRYQVWKKWKKSYVVFNYCPFCGSKIEA